MHLTFSVKCDVILHFRRIQLISKTNVTEIITHKKTRLCWWFHDSRCIYWNKKKLLWNMCRTSLVLN